MRHRCFLCIISFFDIFTTYQQTHLDQTFPSFVKRFAFSQRTQLTLRVQGASENGSRDIFVNSWKRSSSSAKSFNYTEKECHGASNVQLVFFPMFNKGMLIISAAQSISKCLSDTGLQKGRDAMCISHPC